MSEPRLFQILDRINQEDVNNNSSNLGVCNQVISSVETKNGSKVTIGGPVGTTSKIMRNDVYVLMVIIDRSHYVATKEEMEKEASNV